MDGFSPKRKHSKRPALSNTAKKPAIQNGKCPEGVFLGGSCNPTTWRRDIAVPFLEKNGIPYFNPFCYSFAIYYTTPVTVKEYFVPRNGIKKLFCCAWVQALQVDEWHPDLIAQEASAKELSSCLLFVFQPHLTRGLVSLLEVAYLAAVVDHTPCKRNPRNSRVIFIVRPNPYSEKAPESNKINSTPTEVEQIGAAYRWLEGLRSPNVRFFEHLEDALCCIKALYSCQKVGKNQISTANPNRRRSRRTMRCLEDAFLAKKPQKVTVERLLAAYEFSPLYRELTTAPDVDLYCGGEVPEGGREGAAATAGWVLGRHNAAGDFALSMAVQRRCPRLYFHISRKSLWIVEQMEAAYAIGSGKEVLLCLEFLGEISESRSERSSGYSSLASTPDEAFHPPGAVSSPSTSSALSRTSSASDYEENRTTVQAMASIKVKRSQGSEDKGTPFKEGRMKISPVSFHSKVEHDTGILGLPPPAIKDHNRMRTYLKSIHEEVGESSGKGLFLTRPPNNVSEILQLIL